MKGGEVRYVVLGESTRVFCPYAFREVIKALPGSSRTWDPVGKHWTISTLFVNETAAAFRRLHITVRVTNRDGTPYTEPADPRRGGEVPQWAGGGSDADVLDALFERVGPTRRDPLYRALATILHPDKETGDSALMQHLNAVVARRRGLS